MATTIKLKNSVVSGKVPAISDLVLGELALNANSATPALYFKDNADNIVALQPGSGVEPSPTPPASPSPGDLWFDTGNNTLNYWNGSEWEVITGDTDSLWKEDGNAVTPKATGADLAIEGSATFAGADITLNADGSIVASADATINDVTVGQGGGSVATNTAIGASALTANITGEYNTAVGREALQNNTTGVGNTSVGLNALPSNTTGNSNTAIGRYAGYYIKGDNNTILGAYQGTEADETLSDTVIISAGPTERMRIDISGDVKIGGTLPSAPHIVLMASGSAAFTGKVTAPTFDLEALPALP